MKVTQLYKIHISNKYPSIIIVMRALENNPIKLRMLLLAQLAKTFAAGGVLGTLRARFSNRVDGLSNKVATLGIVTDIEVVIELSSERLSTIELDEAAADLMSVGPNHLSEVTDSPTASSWCRKFPNV